MELPGLFSCVWLLFVQYCLRFIHVVAALVCRGLCSVSLPYCAFIHPAVCGSGSCGWGNAFKKLILLKNNKVQSQFNEFLWLEPATQGPWSSRDGFWSQEAPSCPASQAPWRSPLFWPLSRVGVLPVCELNAAAPHGCVLLGKKFEGLSQAVLWEGRRFAEPHAVDVNLRQELPMIAYSS